MMVQGCWSFTSLGKMTLSVVKNEVSGAVGGINTVLNRISSYVKNKFLSIASGNGYSAKSAKAIITSGAFLRRVVRNTEPDKIHQVSTLFHLCGVISNYASLILQFVNESDISNQVELIQQRGSLVITSTFILSVLYFTPEILRATGFFRKVRGVAKIIFSTPLFFAGTSFLAFVAGGQAMPAFYLSKKIGAKTTLITFTLASTILAKKYDVAAQLCCLQAINSGALLMVDSTQHINNEFGKTLRYFGPYAVGAAFSAMTILSYSLPSLKKESDRLYRASFFHDHRIIIQTNILNQHLKILNLVTLVNEYTQSFHHERRRVHQNNEIDIEDFFMNSSSSSSCAPLNRDEQSLQTKVSQEKKFVLNLLSYTRPEPLTKEQLTHYFGPYNP